MKRETSSPTIPCPSCKGRGFVKLSPRLSKVLKAVVAGHGVAREVVSAMGYNGSVTAINNALEELRALKLVSRKRGEGKTWVYRVKAV